MSDLHSAAPGPNSPNSPNPAPALAAGETHAPSHIGDFIFGIFARFSAAITLFLLAGIVVSLVVESWPTISTFGWSFLWHSEWDPPAKHFGALVPIYGTI